MKEKNNFAPFVSQRAPWANNSNSIWLASTLKFYRNVSKHLFPGKLDGARQKQLAAIISKVLQESEQLQGCYTVRGEEIGPVEKEYLFEHFLAHDGFHQAHHGEGFTVDGTGEFLAIYNIGDHLQLQLTDCKESIEESWNRLVKIETEVGKAVDFAFSPRFGFLTSHPAHCGTGFMSYLFLHVPALVHTGELSEFLDKHRDEGIEASGMQGSVNELVGDILTVNNRYTLGLSEEEIIKLLRTFATKIVLEENSLRARLKEEQNTIIKNKISRAYGLASYSYQLETVEALNAISLCKLAIDLGWLVGIDHRALNQLFFDCQRAHLTSLFDTKVEPEEISVKRAALVHETFKPTKLQV